MGVAVLLKVATPFQMMILNSNHEIFQYSESSMSDVSRSKVLKIGYGRTYEFSLPNSEILKERVVMIQSVEGYFDHF